VERHVTLLGQLTSVWGGLALLLGGSMGLLAVGASALVPGGAVTEPAGSSIAASLTAGLFAVIGVLALAWGGLHVWVGTLLSRRRPLGRVLALALGVVNLIVLPFGTALGVYALWVLLKNDGRRAFHAT
jgi:hypothetical protein